MGKNGKVGKSSKLGGHGELRSDAIEGDAREGDWKLDGIRSKAGRRPKVKYIDELVRLQFELIKLQDWVQQGSASAKSRSSSRAATPPAKAG